VREAAIVAEMPRLVNQREAPPGEKYVIGHTDINHSSAQMRRMNVDGEHPSHLCRAVVHMSQSSVCNLYEKREVKIRPIEDRSWQRALRTLPALRASPLCAVSANRLSLRLHCVLERLSFRAIFWLSVIDESAPVEANLS
jgi:hypothetical protein